MILRHTMRAYFRQEKGMRYDERGKRVQSARKATSFIEAKIEIDIRYQCSDRERGESADGALLAIAVKDALLSERYSEAQRMAWERGAAIRISITGTAGDVTSPRYALQESRRRYEDIIGELGGLEEWNAQQGTQYRSAERAGIALWHEERDGGTSYPGLDVHDEVYLGRDCTRVLVGHSCGQITSEIREAFPELIPLQRYHMADMRAGAPDQERAIRLATKDRLRMEPHAIVWPNHASKEQHLDLLGILDSKSTEEILLDGQIFRANAVYADRDPAGYRYGTAWCAHWIPDEALALIRELMVQHEREKR